jgi:Flp pilus assembly pilin Flp
VFRLILRLWRNEDVQPDEPQEPVEPTPENPRDDERGQSFVEYAVILVWLTLAFIGFIRGVGQATHGIWITANSSLTQANTTGAGH